MKLKCVRKADSRDPSFTEGGVYDVVKEGPDTYLVLGDDKAAWDIEKGTLEFSGMPECGIFEIVEEASDVNQTTVSNPDFPKVTRESYAHHPSQDEHKEPTYIATLRSIQEQCYKANLSISIDPSGFNIFDCDTAMQTMVHSVAETIEILETKIEYKDSMVRWVWL